ncbi:superinfection immunity protein [Shewanella nanhaiensis]|uniref:Superinfection immunity protein n=1 Tax=Shewanella nanhaiensis TaxID=2864872 RepID=A0ABS7E609_9GAMM|nr:superinfection immunity protein [Shewanella nanhaiensis]MBW8184975.1 superinfection immunity protein [Shewanella nanhaiensis]
MFLSNFGSGKMVLLLPLLFAIYFLPSIIAVLLNREHKGKIMAANIPAGISWIVWFGILAWAISGREKVKF